MISATTAARLNVVPLFLDKFSIKIGVDRFPFSAYFQNGSLMKPKILLIESGEEKMRRFMNLVGDIAYVTVVHRVAEENGTYRYYRRSGVGTKEGGVEIVLKLFSAVVLNFDISNETEDRTLTSFELIASWQCEEDFKARVLLMISDVGQLVRCRRFMQGFGLEDERDLTPIVHSVPGIALLIKIIRGLDSP